MVYMFRETLLDKEQYIIDICLNTLNITKNIICFNFQYTPLCTDYYREMIVPESQKFDNNGRHVLTLGKEIYCIELHIKIQYCFILKQFQFLHCFTCYRKWVYISNQFLFHFTKVCYELHSIFFLMYNEHRRSVLRFMYWYER